MASTNDRGGIRETDVWAAADALLLEGARPTIERIRQKAGRGSPNTVGPYLDTWFKGLGARIRDPGAFAAAPAIPDPVAQAAAHFWEAALATARGEINAAFADERDALARERDALATAGEDLASRSRELAARTAAQDEAMHLAQAQLAELRTQRDDLQAQLQERTRAVVTLDAKLTAQAAEYAAARAQHEDERAKFDERLRATEERAAAHERRWLQEVDRAREATRAAEARATRSEHDARAQAEHLGGQVAQAQELARRHHARVAALEPALERLQRDALEHAQVVADLRATAAAREASHAEHIETLQQQLATMVQQLADKDREHAALLRQLLDDTQRAHAVKGRRRPARV